MKVFLLLLHLLFLTTLQKRKNNDLNKRCQKLPIFKKDMTEKEIINWALAFDLELNLNDYNYIENIKPILKKKLKKLNRDEILTYMTWCMRRERFSEGFILAHSSELAFLSKRLKIITK